MYDNGNACGRRVQRRPRCAPCCNSFMFGLQLHAGCIRVSTAVQLLTGTFIAEPPPVTVPSRASHTGLNGLPQHSGHYRVRPALNSSLNAFVEVQQNNAHSLTK
ncbi:unnamed protein product [Ostreobium quekettii]|uniref:Uncharacterized protein n=1 Tax=Ostreobium quekettii TaxID=121088 RepID=A0A8S1IXT8_9CHLO|nr:unnamed protein product [Ostreobium quekettii]